MAYLMARWGERVLILFGRKVEICPMGKFSKSLCMLKEKNQPTKQKNETTTIKIIPQEVCGYLKPLRESILHTLITTYF